VGESRNMLSELEYQQLIAARAKQLGKIQADLDRCYETDLDNAFRVGISRASRSKSITVRQVMRRAC
jgi:hypothetical protein